MFQQAIKNVYLYGNTINVLTFSNTCNNLKLDKNSLTTTNFQQSVFNTLLDSNYIYNIYFNNSFPDSAITITNNNSVGQFFMYKSNTLSKNIIAKHNNFNHTQFTYIDNIICDSNYHYNNLEFRNCSNIKCNNDTSSYGGGVAFYFENCNTAYLKKSKAYVAGWCGDGYGVQFETSVNGLFQDNSFEIANTCYATVSRFGIRLNNSNNVDLKNNQINCTDFNHEGYGIISYGTSNNINIEGNSIINSRKGMLLDQLQSYTIRDNTIINVKDFFIQINGSNGLIENNTMNTIVAGNGINLYASNTQVRSNKITTINEGLCISNNNNNNTFINNYLHAGGLGIAKGIVCNTVNNTIAYNNSINITSVDRIKGRAIEINGGSGVTLKNNILSNREGGYSLYITGNPTSLDFNYNDYYSFKNKIVSYNGIEYDSISVWKTISGFDANSLDYNPYYLSDTCLKHNQMKLYNAALQIPSVPNDIYNVSRGTTPDIGAYEYTKCAIDAGVDRFIGLVNPLSVGIIPIVVELENHGTTTLTSVTVNWTVNGISQPPYSWSGSLNADSTTIIALGNYIFTAGTTYNLTATTFLPNGGSDCNNNNNSATITELAAKLCGVYTIGGVNPNFANFTEAAAALNNAGISCSVIFKVRNGTYNEHIIINQIQGASDTATITFESESGDSTLAVLSYDLSDPTNDYTITLNGTDYIRFNQLGIKRNNGVGNVIVQNGCKDVRFTNNYLNNFTSTGLDSLLIFRKNNLSNNTLSIDYSANGFSKDIRINNNKFKGITLNKIIGAIIDSNYCLWSDWNGGTITVFSITNSNGIGIYYDSIITSNLYTAIGMTSNNNKSLKIRNNYLQFPGGCNGLGLNSTSDTSLLVENNKFLLQNGFNNWCGTRDAILVNGGDSLYIRNNNIISPNHDYSGTGININNSGITNYEISNNYIEFLTSGMTLFNISANNLVKFNTVLKSKNYGIKITGNNGLIIKNTVYDVIGGIGIINEAGNTNYFQNKVSDVYENIAMTNNADGVNIQNNYFHSKGSLYPIGIKFLNNPSNCNILYNSINVSGNGAENGAAIEIQKATNLTMKNNIFANQVNGFALKLNDTNSTIISDKNCYFTQGLYLFNKNGQSIQKLNQWIISSGQDVNSKNINPFYCSDTNLQMNQIQLNNIALPISGITIDIDSTVRNVTPDIGAKEFNPCAIDAGIDSIIGITHNLTTPTQVIKGLLQNHSTTTSLNSAKIYYSVNGVTQAVYNWPGTLAPGASTIITFPGNFTFTAAQSNLKIWTTLPNGVADCNNYNDTARFDRISGPLCGIYYIAGTNPDFRTIADAAYALNNAGISCPVTFRLRDTTFNQNISIGPVKGNSFVNTITFERDTFLTTFPGINYTLTDPNNDYALRIDSTTHVTFRNLTITKQNVTKCIWLRKLNNYLTFDNCKVNGLITDTLGIDSVLLINNCDFKNNTLTIIGDNNKMSKNITIKNSINIWETKLYSLERIYIDSSMFYANIGDYNNILHFNINVENCKDFSLKNSNLRIYCWGNANSVSLTNVENIFLDNNSLYARGNYDSRTICFYNSKNLTLSNNIINSNWSGWTRGIYAEKSKNIKLTSNNINCNNQYYSYGIYFVDSIFNVNINNNEINYSYEGITCNLHSLSDSIINNTIHNVVTIGINIQGDSSVVQKNRIINTANIIGLYVQSRNAKIQQNRILNLTESEGIRISGQNNLVCNNVIQIGGYGVAKGFVLTTGSDSSKIIHNSVNITSTDPLKGKAIEINGGNYFQVKNNIFNNKGGGYGAYFNSMPIGLSTRWNTNAYYTPTYKIGYYNNTDYNSVTNLNGTIGSGADYGFYNPYYASDTNFLPYQRFLNGAAIFFPEVIVDHFDKLRNAQAPDIGAIEFKVDFGITQLLSPTLECYHGTNDTVVLYLKQYGDIPFTDIVLAYTINNGTINYDTIQGSTFNDITHSFPVTINLSADNTYIFKLWIIDAYDDNKANDTLIAIRYSKPAPVINFSAPTYCDHLTTYFASTATIANPYIINTYQWDFGDGYNDTIANPAHVYDSIGSYLVKLRAYSSAGCYKDTSIIIVVHTVPKALFTTEPQCKGTPVTLINNSYISSTDSITYSWDFGDNSNSTLNSPTHIYSSTGSIPIQLIATSSYGCKDTVTHYNSIYTLPIIQFNKQNISCNGLLDGTVISNVTSGNPTYHYLWSNGALTSTINNLSQGTYILTVTDSLGCVDKDTTTIIEPFPITINFNKKSYVCNGMNDGWIKAISNGGIIPYIYNWSNGQTGDSIYNLNNGTYQVTVKDSNNCQKTDSVNIPAMPQPNLQFTHTDVLCYGGNTGTAMATATGGQIPYSYQWLTTPIQAVQNIQNLIKGYYSARVTDSYGCENLDSVFINQPDSFHFTVKYITPLCNGDSNGTITVITTGATAPYLYSWNTNPAQTTETINNLLSGNYNVVIKDQNNCDTTLQLTLIQPNVLNIQTQITNQSCSNYCNGKIEVIVNGGTLPYVYSWNTTPIQTDSIAINLCEGLYSITVKDSNNCTISKQSISLQTNTNILASFTTNPNQGFSPLNVNFTFTGNGATIYNWDFGDGNTSNQQNPMNIYQNKGNYHIVLTANSGTPDFCIDTASFDIFVDEPSEIIVPNVFTPNGDGVNDYFFAKAKGLIDFKMYIYNRWGKEIFSIETLDGKWDGKCMNTDAPQGVYYYIIKAVGKDNKNYERHGSIELIR